MPRLPGSPFLRDTEIDALFLAVCDVDGSQVRAIVTCEAKGEDQRILEHQIVEQAKAAFVETSVDLVIPIGLRAVRRVGFYLVEFQPVASQDPGALSELSVAKEAVYELKPAGRLLARVRFNAVRNRHTDECRSRKREPIAAGVDVMLTSPCLPASLRGKQEGTKPRLGPSLAR
jgi:hypothetical protein